MSSLEKKKKQLELQRVQTAKMEMEFKIEERLEEIERLKQQVLIQTNKEQELKKEIGE